MMIAYLPPWSVVLATASTRRPSAKSVGFAGAGADPGDPCDPRDNPDLVGAVPCYDLFMEVLAMELSTRPSEITVRLAWESGTLTRKL